MRLLFPILWLAFCFGAFEVGARKWTEKYGDALDKTRPIVWADATLGWRQRPNLDTQFQDRPLRTNELGWRAPPLAQLTKPRKILLLGPSSAFGWGVAEDKTYGAELEKILRLLGVDAEVINGGEIGFSSFQGVRLLKSAEVAALKPEVILIAYGVNDVDRHRFYFQSPAPDSQELAEPKENIEAYRLLSRSSAANLVWKIAFELRTRLAPPRVPAEPVPALRVAPEEFRKNLRELASEGRRLGARVLFLGTPANLPGAPAPSPAASGAFDEGVRHYSQGRFEQALGAFELATRLHSAGNEAYYYLQAAALQLGQRAEAARYASAAKKSEPVRIHRDILVYNEVMRKTAEQEGVEFVDLYGAFARVAQQLPLFFLDPIHPSESGHRIIGQAISKALLEKMKSK